MAWNELIPFPVLVLVGFGGWMLIRTVHTHHWVRKVLGRTFSVLLLLASSGLLVMLGWYEAFDRQYLYRSAIVEAPDRRHSAYITECGPSCVGAFVEVRRPWHVYPQTVFQSLDDPRFVKVQWSGAKRLIIKVPDSPEDLQRQCSSLNDVTVSCVSYGPVP
jgi:hypothetical protein